MADPVAAAELIARKAPLANRLSDLPPGGLAMLITVEEIDGGIHFKSSMYPPDMSNVTARGLLAHIHDYVCELQAGQ